MKPTTLRIGLHAPRNAGKTCLFACLYGLRHLFADQIIFDDDDSLTYLRGAWKYIREGSVPPATAMTRPTRLNWRLASGEDNWNLITFDYPGVLVEPSGDGAVRELRAEARDWFRSTSALLILVDSEAPDVEQLDVVELLLAELAREAAELKTPPRPLALVLTKWDTQGAISADREEERERLQKYLIEHPIFVRIRGLLTEAAGAFEIFTISAFGRPGPGPGLAPPIDQLRPYNLLAPWKWAATQSRRVAQTNRRRRASRKVLAASVALTALGTLGIGTSLFGRQQAAEQFTSLEQLRAEKPDEAQAADRVAASQAFLASWQSYTAPDRRSLAQRWLDQDRATAQAFEQRQRLARRYQEIQSEGRKVLESDPGRTYGFCQAFLDDFPDASERSTVRQLQVDALRLWQTQARSRVEETRRAYESGGGKDPSACVAAVQAYLAIPGIPADYRAEAITWLKTVEEAWDRAEYDAMVNALRTGLTSDAAVQTNPDVLVTVDRLAEQYLKAPRERKSMARAVEGWRAWFARLHADHNYHIRVKSVTIPAGSELDSWLGTDVRVKLTLGEQSFRTKPYKTLTPTVMEDLGPYRFRWGSPTRLEVVVQNHFSVLNNDEAGPAVVTDERFILGHTNGTIKVKCDRGKEITIELECREAAPPPLPIYVKTGAAP